MSADVHAGAHSDPLLAKIETVDPSPGAVVLEFEVSPTVPQESVLRKATGKERRYLERLEYHGDRKLAAKEAGFPTASPTKIEQRIGQTELAIRLEHAGITDEYLAVRLKDGMEAEKNFRTGSEGFTQEPDWTNRHRFLETTLNIKGYHRTEVVHHEGRVGFDMSGLLLGAFRIMAKSSGVEIDEEKLRREIIELAVPAEPFAPMEALAAQKQSIDDPDG